MRVFNFRSIQSNIFLSVSAIVATVLAGSVFLYLFAAVNTFRNNYRTTSNQMAKILSSRLDGMVNEVDKLQARILESDTIREYIFSDFSDEGRSSESALGQTQFEKEIFSLSGYDYPFYHLSVLTFDNHLLSFGCYYGSDHLEENDTPPEWSAYKNDVAANRGSKYLSALTDPKLYSGSDAAVSVSRSFSRYPLNPARAIMEIQISHTAISDNINAALLSYKNLSNKVVVFSDEGSLVYPVDTNSVELEHYTKAIVDQRVKNSVTGTEELISRFESEYTGWTVAVITPYAAITAGLQQYVLYAVLVGVVALVALLGIAFRVAQNISAPIIAIKESLLKVELDTLRQTDTQSIKTRYNELELLQSSVEEMRRKLEKSLDDYVHMRSLSIQSRMMALQSQMNPHFMYNTLSIMAILAEEKGDIEVSNMCHQLVAMLRYTSAEQEITTLGKELEHTYQYAELVKMRFGSSVHISYDIDPTLLQVEMPPILLQPLVENSVKYGRTGHSKLSISVRAFQENLKWFVQVEDNGTGFTDEALLNLKEKIKQEKNQDKISQYEIQGMGLANIYLRLQLFYDGDFTFEIENTTNGASITVGGLILD